MQEETSLEDVHPDGHSVWGGVCPAVTAASAACCWVRCPMMVVQQNGPVSGVVTLCLCDNAVVICTRYCNDCWYKETFSSSGCWSEGGVGRCWTIAQAQCCIHHHPPHTHTLAYNRRKW